MGRSRSRSPARRERRRSRSGSRERRRTSRSRSRERRRRSPAAERRRSRSPKGGRRRSPGRRGRSSSNSPSRPGKAGGSRAAKNEPRVLTEEDLEGKTEEEIEMMKIMGFSEFDSTKGRKVEGAVNAYAINVSQKRKYRQYMNRKGGFNRPLDFVA